LAEPSSYEAVVFDDAAQSSPVSYQLASSH
jgi:hypothetical protein